MSFITINHITFYYETWREDNPPVVFIAGYTGNIDLWRSTAERVAEYGHKVLIFDNQAIGKTQDQGEILNARACP